MIGIIWIKPANVHLLTKSVHLEYLDINHWYPCGVISNCNFVGIKLINIVKNSTGFAQLFLRMALAVGFILPVMDRLGFLGKLGTGMVNWGDWEHFINYTNSLVPYLSRPLANLFGYIATIAEALFGGCLLVGYKIRYAALGTAILTFIFAICMATSYGISAPFKYPVFVFTGAALTLSGLTSFRWSIDCGW